MTKCQKHQVQLKLWFSSETAKVPATVCVLPRAIIHFSKYKNIFQFVLFVEHSISTCKDTRLPAPPAQEVVPLRPRPCLVLSGLCYFRTLLCVGGSTPPQAPAPTEMSGKRALKPAEVGVSWDRPCGSMGQSAVIQHLPGVLFFSPLTKYT